MQVQAWHALVLIKELIDVHACHIASCNITREKLINTAFGRVQNKTKQNPYFVSSTADFVFTFQIFGSDDDDDDMRERSPEKEFIPFPSSFFIQLGPLDLSGMLLQWQPFSS